MEAVLYASVSGALVLVPECFSPSNDLEHAHGRLMPCGRISLEEDAFPDLCRRISFDFDRMSYCVLSARDADRLFAAKALWKLYERRRTPRSTKGIDEPKPPTLGVTAPSNVQRPMEDAARARFRTLLRAFLHLPTRGSA